MEFNSIIVRGDKVSHDLINFFNVLYPMSFEFLLINFVKLLTYLWDDFIWTVGE